MLWASGQWLKESGNGIGCFLGFLTVGSPEEADRPAPRRARIRVEELRWARKEATAAGSRGGVLAVAIVRDLGLRKLEGYNDLEWARR